jgi:glutathione synthase
MKIAFLLYPTQGVKVNEDSSFWMMHELVRRGHHVFYFESRHLIWQNGTPQAFLRAAKLDTKRGYLPTPLSAAPATLSSFDCIFIRKEPPFDAGYVNSLQILSVIRKKTFILNDPVGMLACGEKLCGLALKGLCPESLVTSDILAAQNFIISLKSRTVLKPLDNKGGAGVLSVFPGDKSLPRLLKHSTANGTRKILIQRFIPHQETGDKRILILNGEIIGAFLRKPAKHEFRANLSLGGSMHPCKILARDRQIVLALKPILEQNGLYFTGIDVINGYLSEVNVTSPSGIPEIKELYGINLQEKIADFLEQKI